MSKLAWYNPLDWAADAAADALGDQLNKLKGKILDDPKILVVPLAIVTTVPAVALFGYSAAIEAGRATGSQAGKDLSKELKKWQLKV